VETINRKGGACMLVTDQATLKRLMTKLEKADYDLDVLSPEEKAEFVRISKLSEIEHVSIRN